MKKKLWLIFWMMIVILILALGVCLKESKQENIISQTSNEESLNDIIIEKEESDTQDVELIIELQDLDGTGNHFSFVYHEETFIANFSNGVWKIIDSYKIKNHKDVETICQALIDIHPVLGRDGTSYRTAEDMAYEWMQHNLAYEVLPEGNVWKEHAKDVDLDPEDQGKNLAEIYEARTGEHLNIPNIY